MLMKAKLSQLKSIWISCIQLNHGQGESFQISKKENNLKVVKRMIATNIVCARGFSIYSDAHMHFGELIGKARSGCQCYLPLAYSDNTVMSLSVNPWECRCCDSHNPPCFILSIGECRPSQLSETWHTRHDDRVPISCSPGPSFPSFLFRPLPGCI